MNIVNNTRHQRYSKLVINNSLYKPDDAIIIKNNKEKEVAMIKEIFDSEDETIIVVRKYIFARNLRKLFKKQGVEYDEKNEVVQDLSKLYNINAKDIHEKCSIAFLCTDDNVYYISENYIDQTSYFSCRFTIRGNQLFPIFNNVLTEKSLNSPITKLNSVGKQKNNCTPITNRTSTIEVYFDNDISPPAQRNSVKRNLNKSFGNSPTTENKSILNYSIVDEENDDELILKLKVSTKRNHQTTEKLVASPPKVRKSNRDICRKSYADYISPIKTTPSKRRLARSKEDSDDDDSDPRQNTVCKMSPRKQLRSENSTPKRENGSNYDKDLLSMYKRTPRGTPARRSLRLASTDIEKSPKSVRRTRKNISYREEELGIGKIETNLNESLRRNILKKTNSTNDEIDNNTINLIDADDDDDDKDEIINLDDSIECKTMQIHLEKLNLNKKNKDDDKFFFGNESDSDCTDKSTPIKPKSSIKTGKQSSHTPKSNKKSHTSIVNKKNNKDSDEKFCENEYDSDSTSIKVISREKTRKKSSYTPKTKSEVSNTPSKKVATPKVGTPKTPKNRAKLIREGVVTPSMHERSKKVKGDTTPLMKARSQLHVSYVPESLPCREKEYCDIHNFIESKLMDGCGGCMYISGVPGTGKTATVTSVISNLQTNKKVPKFTFVNINGMRLTEPRQSYVEILKQLNGKALSWEQAQNTLEEMFLKQKKMTPIVMLIDELDILCTKRQDVVYNLLDWPTKAKNQLIVLTIANTMDLPERLLMNRVTSRLGLTRLTFQAYTYKQLQEIVTKRIYGTDSFNSDAVQFVARKVASVSGDARRALDICRRAAEIAEVEGKVQLVSMNHVNEALSAMITQPKVLAIKSCSRLEQLILQSTVAEVERTGVEETTFCDVYKMLLTCSGIEGFKMVSQTLALSAVSRLSACRLILADQKCNNIHQKIILNVSVDDVYYALKQN